MGLISIGQEYIGGSLCVVVAISLDARYKLTFDANDDRKQLQALIETEVPEQSVQSAMLHYTGVDKPQSPSELAIRLPGVDLLLKNPVTGSSGSLYSIVIDLNDRHKWTREEIAQWIENTCDIKDIAFKVPEGGLDGSGKVSKSTSLVTIQRVLSG